MAIPDGTYRATLEDARLYKGTMDEMCVQFVWRIPQFDCVKFYNVSSLRSDRGPANFMFALLRNWAPDFPADNNFKWFANNVERCSKYPVEVVISEGRVVLARKPPEDAQSVNEPPPEARRVKTPNDGREGVTLFCNKANLDSYLLPDEPTMDDVYGFFKALTQLPDPPIALPNSDSYGIVQSRVWLTLVQVIGKDQIAFTTDDWRRMEKFVRTIGARAGEDGKIVIPATFKFD